jgi:hypothetical protein
MTDMMRPIHDAPAGEPIRLESCIELSTLGATAETLRSLNIDAIVCGSKTYVTPADACRVRSFLENPK